MTLEKILDLLKAMFLRIRSHGKPPFFTTIWENMFGSLLPSMEESQIQEIGPLPKAFNDLKSISPW